MDDYRIRMQFDIDADEAAVRQALATREGIAAWWSNTVEGEPSQRGGDLLVTFPDIPQPFHFRVDENGGEVSWQTLEFPPWWAGTTIRWAMAPSPDTPGTRLLFTHEGFDPEAEIIPVITPAWAAIIERLRRYAESGKIDPYARN